MKLKEKVWEQSCLKLKRKVPDSLFFSRCASPPKSDGQVFTADGVAPHQVFVFQAALQRWGTTRNFPGDFDFVTARKESTSVSDLPTALSETPDRSSSSSTRVVQDVLDVFRDELGVVPDEVVLALRGAVSRSSVDDFGLFEVGMLRRVYFGPILKLEDPCSWQLCFSWQRSVTDS